MKKILIVISLLFVIKSQAQTDTTKVLNVSLSARLIEYLAPFVANPDNDENFGTFLKWRTAFRASAPTGNTAVITDTITVNTIAYLYNTVLQNQEGFAFGTSFKAAIVSARNANSNLDRQCTFIEGLFNNQTISMRRTGRKLLTGQ